MCFSATASFAASSLLTVIGFLSLTIAPQRLRLFASTPLFFALQQASEGFIWLTASSPGLIFDTARYIFLFFAFIFWPVWISYVLIPIEQIPWRKKVLQGTLILGGLFGIYALYYLVTHTIDVSAAGNHVSYTLSPLPTYYYWAQPLYIIAVIVPLFISSLRSVWLLGAGIVGGFFLATWVYPHYFTSTWCFFAAIVSLLVGYIVVQNKE